MERKKLAVFDLDGTILNTIDDLAASTNYALRNNGLPERSLEEITAFVGNGVRTLIGRAVPEGTDIRIEEKAFADLKAHYAVHSNDQTRPYDGIVELFRRLQEEGVRIAVVSNKLDSAVKVLMKIYFAGIPEVSLGEVPELPRKPAPDMVWHILDELGVAKEEAVYIGDSEVDYATAVNSGLDHILVTWGFRSKEALQQAGASVFADSVEELQRLLLG